jgi:peptide deformylase
MATYPIRLFGDPVLKRPAADVAEFDGALAKLVDAMYETMYAAPGVGLAAPQVGVQRRFFVYDVGEGPHVLANPRIVEAEGEWEYEEGCLSLPGLAFEIVRPKVVTITGVDLAGVPARDRPPRRRAHARPARTRRSQARAPHAARAGDERRPRPHRPPPCAVILVARAPLAAP